MQEAHEVGPELEGMMISEHIGRVALTLTLTVRRPWSGTFISSWKSQSSMAPRVLCTSVWSRSSTSVLAGIEESLPYICVLPLPFLWYLGRWGLSTIGLMLGTEPRKSRVCWGSSRNLRMAGSAVLGLACKYR